jgi:DNA-binding NarL/FixJ family response regulator
MGIFNAKPESEPAEEPKRKTRSRRNLRKENAEDGHGVDLRFDKGRENGRNSNERILELHKAGKSNMAIAKELGLGLGEVKLVIDLFEGM